MISSSSAVHLHPRTGGAAGLPPSPSRPGGCTARAGGCHPGGAARGGSEQKRGCEERGGPMGWQAVTVGRPVGGACSCMGTACDMGMLCRHNAIGTLSEPGVGLGPPSSWRGRGGGAAPTPRSGVFARARQVRDLWPTLPHAEQRCGLFLREEGVFCSVAGTEGALLGWGVVCGWGGRASFPPGTGRGGAAGRAAGGAAGGGVRVAAAADGTATLGAGHTAIGVASAGGAAAAAAGAAFASLATLDL
mmetsp:Transcript_36908/g.120671  ORF Transcript_36908/g.120671 Transcript_36908/m.120671 type:complete len:247 (-) Transcript_36908:147-887(-)